MTQKRHVKTAIVNADNFRQIIFLSVMCIEL